MTNNKSQRSTSTISKIKYPNLYYLSNYFKTLVEGYFENFDIAYYFKWEREILVGNNIIPAYIYDIISKTDLTTLTESTCRRFGKSSYEQSLILLRLIALPFFNHGFGLKHKRRFEESGRTAWESVIDRFQMKGIINWEEAVYLKDKCLSNKWFEFDGRRIVFVSIETRAGALGSQPTSNTILDTPKNVYQNMIERHGPRIRLKIKSSISQLSSDELFKLYESQIIKNSEFLKKELIKESSKNNEKIDDEANKLLIESTIQNYIDEEIKKYNEQEWISKYEEIEYEKDISTYKKLLPLYCGLTIDEVQYQDEQGKEEADKELTYDFQIDSINSMIASLNRGIINPWFTHDFQKYLLNPWDSKHPIYQNYVQVMERKDAGIKLIRYNQSDLEYVSKVEYNEKILLEGKGFIYHEWIQKVELDSGEIVELKHGILVASWRAIPPSRFDKKLEADMRKIREENLGNFNAIYGGLPSDIFDYTSYVYRHNLEIIKSIDILEKINLNDFRYFIEGIIFSQDIATGVKVRSSWCCFVVHLIVFDRKTSKKMIAPWYVNKWTHTKNNLFVTNDLIIDNYNKVINELIDLKLIKYAPQDNYRYIIFDNRARWAIDMLNGWRDFPERFINYPEERKIIAKPYDQKKWDVNKRVSALNNWIAMGKYVYPMGRSEVINDIHTSLNDIQWSKRRSGERIEASELSTKDIWKIDVIDAIDIGLSEIKGF